jgi:hypothetical protein
MEVRRLRQEVANLRLHREILKKRLAFLPRSLFLSSFSILPLPPAKV